MGFGPADASAPAEDDTRREMPPVPLLAPVRYVHRASILRSNCANPIFVFFTAMLCSAGALLLWQDHKTVLPGCDNYRQTCTLFDGIVERSQVMRDVAAAKASAAASLAVCVFDAAQEAHMLEAAAAEATQNRVAVAAAVVVAQLQADCAKQEQAHWLALWEANGSWPEPSRPLPLLRAELQALTGRITHWWSLVLGGEWLAHSCTTLQRDLPRLLDGSVDSGELGSKYCAGTLYRQALLASLLSARDPPCPAQ